MSETTGLPAPIVHESLKSDALYPVDKDSEITKRIPIGEIEVRSKEQPRMSLGFYAASNPPKGFAIHINPDPEPETIVTQITHLGTNEKYELVLHIANYGNTTVSAEIWRL